MTVYLRLLWRRTNLTRRIGCLVCVGLIISSIASCTDSDDDINFDVPLFDVYYINIDTDSGTAFLIASRFDEPPDVHAEVIEPDFTSNDRYSWVFSGQETVTISSLARLIGPELNLVVPANDGLMQIALFNDDDANATAQSEFSNWVLTPLGNGRCHISNSGLGNELVLSITGQRVLPNGMELQSVEMAGVSDELPQQWTITRIGDPPGNYEQMCSGSL